MAFDISKKIDSIYHISHNSNESILSLEGLRAIAAIMVFVVHYAAQFLPWINKESFTWQLIIDYRYIGAKGVELFFVISGFLIYGILIKNKPKMSSYLSRRLKRLYPTFLSVLFLYVLLSFLFPNESKLPNEIKDIFIYLLANALMLPGIFDIQAMMTVAWTLSYEMFLYLTLPVFIYFLRFHYLQPKLRVLILLAITSVSFILIYFGFTKYEKMVLFLGGMLVFELKDNDKIRINTPYLLLICFTALLVVKHLNLHHVLLMCTLYLGFSIVLHSCIGDKNKFSQLCKNTILRYFGNMSYSYYLIHGLTLKFFFIVLGMIYPPNHQWDLAFYIFIAPAFVLTCITSTCLFMLIEKPFSFRKSRLNASQVF